MLPARERLSERHLPTVEEKQLSFYVKRRRKIHFPQMSGTAILQQEPVMTSEVKLSETETICMLDKSATEAPPLLKTVNRECVEVNITYESICRKGVRLCVKIRMDLGAEMFPYSSWQWV
jgi:hypothetical protein